MEENPLHLNNHINPEEMTLTEKENYFSCNQVDPLLLEKLHADLRKGSTLLVKRWQS